MNSCEIIYAVDRVYYFFAFKIEVAQDADIYTIPYE